jgi:hypothetical protein
MLDGLRVAAVHALDGLDWALTGSTSFALRGVPVEPDDVDVRTTERGAYEARACERLGRDERAALLRAHAEDEH